KQITPVSWNDHINTLSNWGSFIMNLTDWSVWIDNLSWTSFIPGVGWGNYIGNVAWDLFINDFDGWPDVSGMWNGWPSIQEQWDGWPSIQEQWDGWPSIQEQWDGWPSIQEQWDGWPDLGDLWPGWSTYLPVIDAQSFIDSVISGEPEETDDTDDTDADEDDGELPPSQIPADPDEVAEDNPMIPNPDSGGGGDVPEGVRGDRSDEVSDGEVGFNPDYGLATGGLIDSDGVAMLHEGERVVPEAQVSDRGPAPIEATADVDTSTIEDKLDRLHSDLQQLQRAMDVSLQVDKETLGRATNDARRNRMGDTDPTV
ncbi:hypothetical protein OSG_eHP3_00005, partial [environmental Halophage eHP-3]